ncbi:MAG TPA: hypothetical protein VKK06_19245 [Terriglobia bacterium]|nr:hypothetical protein [Terriglobia bacterium]
MAARLFELMFTRNKRWDDQLLGPLGAREFTESHEQTKTNPAQSLERVEDAGECRLRRPTDGLGKLV